MHDLDVVFVGERPQRPRWLFRIERNDGFEVEGLDEGEVQRLERIAAKYSLPDDAVLIWRVQHVS
jgi:hypothetical protein